MSWRENLLPSNYMGIPLLVTGVTKSYAHMQAKHQFVNKNGAYFESMAEDAEKISVTAYTIGDNCFIDRDRLVEALRKNPKGMYTDPFEGVSYYVAVLTWDVTEGVREGMGFVAIDIQFAESLTDPFLEFLGKTKPPNRTTTTAYQKYADAVAASAVGKVLTAATGYAEGAASAVERVTTEVDAIKAAIYGPLSGLILSVQSVASAVERLEGSVISLALAPLSLWSSLTNIWSTINSLEVLRSFSGSHVPLVVPTGIVDPGESAYWAAQVAIWHAVQMTCLNQQAYQIQSALWESADEALAARDEWTAAMMAEEPYLTEQAYASWVDARIQLSAYLEQVALGLPKLMYVEIESPVSVLELAQRHYVDYRRAPEILNRNLSIVHPGFITGNITLLQPVGA